MRYSLPATVRIAAVVVGAANVFLLAALTIYFAATGAEEFEGLTWYHVVLGLFVTSVAGLLIAEVVLRLARRVLRGRFFSRYVAMVLAVCLGGAFTVLLPALIIAFAFAASASSWGTNMSLLQELGKFLLPVASFTLMGAALGMIEGLFLAFPLAAILGQFRTAG